MASPIETARNAGNRIVDASRTRIIDRDQRLDPVENASSKIAETIGRMNEYTFSPDLLAKETLRKVDSDILSQARRLKGLHERSLVAGTSSVHSKLVEYHVGEHIEQALSTRSELQNQFVDGDKTERSYEDLTLKLFSGSSDIMTLLVRQEPRRVMRILKDYGAEPLSEHFVYYADTIEEGMKNRDDRLAFVTELADFCSETDEFTGYYENSVLFPLHEGSNHHEKEEGEPRLRRLLFRNPNEVLRDLSDEDAEKIIEQFIRLQDSHAKSFFGVGSRPSHHRRHTRDYEELQRSGSIRNWRSVKKIDGEWRWTRS